MGLSLNKSHRIYNNAYNYRGGQNKNDVEFKTQLGTQTLLLKINIYK